MKIRETTSLSIHENGALAVRIARAEGAGRYRVVWFETTDAEKRPSIRVQRAVSGASGPVTQLMPNADVSYNILPLPPLKTRQRDLALRALLARENGGDPGDWLLDDVDLPGITPGSARARQDVGVSFARQAVVRRHLERAHELGAQPSALTAGYLALDKLYRNHRPEDSEDGAWNLVCLDPKSSFLCVSDSAGMLFQRGLPDDLSGGAELPEYLERLTTEIERSNFFAQQAERSLRVARVIVCGEPALADALVERLSATVETPADRWRPEELFDWPESAIRTDLTLELAGAVAALESGSPNLLPREFRRDRGRTVRRMVRKASTVTAAVAVPLLLAGGLWTAKVQRDSLAALEFREDTLQERAQETALEYLRSRALQARQDNLDRYGDGPIDLASVLVDIAGRTPGSVVYRDLGLLRDPDGGYRLRLCGESLGRDGMQAQEVFLEFQADMRACGWLEEIEEMSRLELAAADEDLDASSRVIFILEYRLTEGRT